MLWSMNEASLDLAAITDSLERSLSETHPILTFGPEFQLRTTNCGISSAAVSQYLQMQGVDARMVIKAPRIKGDPGMYHVVTEAVLDDKLMIIDPTYSQFLGQAGIGLFSMHLPYFPSEKIALFPVTEPERPVDILVESALAFRQAVAAGKTLFMKRGSPLVDASEEVLRAQWIKIWNQDNSRTFVPARATKSAAKYIAQRLLVDAPIS